MRLTAEARHRALSLVRHAAVAAGLGVGWLLLSGQSANADVLGVPSLPVVSNTVSTVESAVPKTGNPLPSSLPQVSDVQQGVSSGISRTTSTLASTVEAAPAVVAPVLTGPLEPLAPVVDQTASGVGTALTTVGGSVASTVETPLPAPLPVAVPALVPATSAPAESAATPIPAAIELPDQATAPGTPATSEAVSPVAAGSASAAFDWAAWTKGPAQLAGTAGAKAPASPANGPDELQLAPAPASTSGGSDGPGAGAPTAASLAGGFLLAVPLFFSGRRRPLSTLVPPPPAFDPGSTPD